MGNKQEFKVAKLGNGITVLGEQMEGVSSAAFSVLVPVGAATDPRGQEGVTNLLTEMFHKGAGKYSSRQMSDMFEDLGVSRSHSAGIEVSIFSGSLLGENLERVLELYSTMLLEPTLPDDELDNTKELALQELKDIEDHPSSKVMVELAKRFYPDPFGRCQTGTEEGIRALKINNLRDYYRREFLPSHSIIAVAGKFDWDGVLKTIENHFGKWQGKKNLLASGELPKSSAQYHMQQETSQLQIALAYPSVAISHPDYYAARVAVGVLSGGMAGRLFIEVREKRGLVYTVSASHSAAKGRAAVFVYAGTTPERGQETLDVTLQELRKLSAGVSDDELGRAKADIKSRVIMQGEASAVRASLLVNDWWSLGRVRTLDEVKSNIDAVTSKDIERHLAQFPVEPITLVTLGPKELIF